MRLAETRRSIARGLDRDGTAWFAGVALPVAMMLLDPAVFRGSDLVGPALLGPYKPLGYVAIGLGVLALSLHLVTARPSAVLAGVLAGASLFGLALGVVLLPFSFLGTIVLGVGLLGLTPFVSGLVVGWRARRAYRGAPPRARPALAALGMVAFFVVCGGVQRLAHDALARSLRDITSGSPEVATVGVERLSRWKLLLDFDLVVEAWVREEDSTKRDRLAAAYQDVTGAPIHDRAIFVSD